jgi:hypothetical protein
MIYRSWKISVGVKHQTDEQYEKRKKEDTKGARAMAWLEEGAIPMRIYLTTTRSSVPRRRVLGRSRVRGVRMAGNVLMK